MSTRAQNTIFIEEAMYKQRRMPHRASVISSTLRTETPARYISMRASSTLLSLRRYNDPAAYADLILNGDPETYLKTVTEYKPLD